MEQDINLEQEPILVQQGGGAVNSVNGQTGDVVLTTSDLENTSDYQTGSDVQLDIQDALGTLATVATTGDYDDLTDKPTIPTAVSQLNNDSDFQTGTQVSNAIGLETTAREGADTNLQGQIDALAAASDVTDIVGTYADLQAYDTSTLGNNDIIKVLQDESRNDETTYYRWSTATQTFTLIGEEGPYYTKSAADQKFQDKLTAGTNISIDPLTDTISASFDAETIFYANLSETGTNRHIYKDIAFTTAASAQDLIDANNEGQVILRGTSTANPTAYSDSYLQNAFIMPHNNDYEFVFLDRDVRYEYSAGATTDTIFYYSTSEVQPKLTAGTNVTITGTTISATDTTYSDFTGTDGQTAGVAGLVPAPATTDEGKFLSAGGAWGTPTDTTYTAGAGLVLTGTVFSGDVNYRALNGASAPTAATEAKYIGQLYYDTTAGDMYYCSAITPQGTDPETYTYTWVQLGGGSSVTVVQATGTSQTDVMSQVATSQMIYPSGYETDQTRIAIGGTASNVHSTAICKGAVASGYGSLAIGLQANGSAGATASEEDTIALGGRSTASERHAIAIGLSAQATGRGAVVIGNGASAAGGSTYVGSVAIGPNAKTGSSTGVAIGQNASANGNRSVAIAANYSGEASGYASGEAAIAISGTASALLSIALGYSAGAVHQSSVALGNGAWTTRANEVTIGNSTTTRYLARVTDPVNAQDAATKNYVDTQIGDIATILQTLNSGTGATEGASA